MPKERPLYNPEMGERHPVVGHFGSPEYGRYARADHDVTSYTSESGIKYWVHNSSTSPEGGSNHIEETRVATHPAEERYYPQTHYPEKVSDTASKNVQGLLFHSQGVGAYPVSDIETTHYGLGEHTVASAATDSTYARQGLATNGLKISHQFLQSKGIELVADEHRSDAGMALSASVAKAHPEAKNADGKYLTDEKPEDILTAHGLAGPEADEDAKYGAALDTPGRAEEGERARKEHSEAARKSTDAVHPHHQLPLF